MKSFALSSGSSGNCFYIESTQKEGILVDCGLSLCTIEALLQKKKRSLDHVKAVFITHEHADHIAGLASLQKKYSFPLYLSKGTGDALQLAEDAYVSIKHHDVIEIGSLRVFCVKKPHDAAEPLSFVLDDGSSKVGIFTDLGHVTSELKALMRSVDVLYIEANYDDVKAKNSEMHYMYINRITSHLGHLSLKECISLLSEISHFEKQIIITHVSENVNSYAHVYRALKTELTLLEKLPRRLIISFQKEATAWVE